MITFRNVSFSYPGSHGTSVLNSIHLTIRDGEWVAVTGGNGSGKSTLCRLIAGLLEPTEGSVLVNGAGPCKPSNAARDRIPVAIAFQNPDSQFLTSTVRREILFGMENMGLDPGTIGMRFEGAVETFGLVSILHRNPHTLSGGEKQRVMLASIWVMNPHHIVLDEPFSFLDSAGRRSFLDAVRDSFHREGLTVVWSTLEPDEIVCADRVLYVENGTLTGDGSPGELASIVADGVLTEPISPYLRDRRSDGTVHSPHGASNQSRFMQMNGGAAAGRCGDSGAYGRKHERTGGQETAGEVQVKRYPAGKPPSLIAMKDARFSQNEGDFVLRISSLNVQRGEIIGITGPSGSGKTTLLLGCSGILPPRDGEVTLFGRRVASTRDRPAGKIAFLFQTPEEGFFSPTVRDEVAFGYRSFHGTTGLDNAVQKALEAVGLDAEAFVDRNPFRLSQGEMRMVAIASLLVLPAEIFFLDEPTLFLDGTARNMVANALSGLRSRGITTMIASHEPRFIHSSAERCISLEGGYVVL